MVKFPPPPEPPTVGEEFLHQLADYYRSLVEYHQRAATAAAQQLAHLESLLHPERLLDFPKDVPYWLTEESPTPSADGDLPESPPPSQLPSVQEEAAPTDSDKGTGGQGELVQPAPSTGPNEPLSTSELAQSPTQVAVIEPTVEASLVLTLLLEAERGKMLHLDFIVRKLYGRLPPLELKRVTAATRQLLEEGASQLKWYAVPDSPDCWTIDLKHFPDLATVERHQPQRASPNRTIPDCEKLSEYGTVKKALAACLEEHSPQSMTIAQVVDWFYPEGLEKAYRSKAYRSISKGLSEGCDRLGWRRVSLGRYVWQGRAN